MISIISIPGGKFLPEYAKKYDEEHFQYIVSHSLWLEFLFSNIGALLNIIHLIVLIRKSLRKTSINIPLIGIAICDFVCMVVIARNGYLIFSLMNECTPPRSSSKLGLDWFLTSVHNALRRCSAWLGTLLTVIRYFMISNISTRTTHFSTPKFGFQTTTFTFFISFIFTLLFYSKKDIQEVNTWYPGPRCQMENISYPVFKQKINQFSDFNNPNKNRTTILTIYISLLFFLSEFPVGIIRICNAIWMDDYRYKEFSRNIVFLCDAMFSINASMHCLLIFTMSSQYREAFWGVINCFKKNTRHIAPATSTRQ
ncbi:Protein CBG06531 [Caenorhabditis briggsae]|uniref:Protein CBG06531 n=1 Tax=Caenorhabditis briggsae TaxID=6238 RepID=A8X2G3_CAEBR|nr:Protein CBG06531 [Caenorhabditis briggsae]CAP26823.2 Protein CBG06531 [Caenorhabditis briggsae]